MSALDLINHGLNFIAPAAWIAVCMALAGRFVLGTRRPGFWVQAGAGFLAGVAVLGLGLLVLGHDGAMATYIALVLVCGSVQWGFTRRRRG